MTKKKQNAPTDYRKQRKDEERNMIKLVLFVLIVVGGGLIGLIYGPVALLGALPCLIGGGIVLALAWAGFALLDKYTD